MSSGKEGKADVEEGVMKFSYFPVDVSTDVAKSLFFLRPVFSGIPFILDNSAVHEYIHCQAHCLIPSDTKARITNINTNNNILYY